jgi:hypothetical protein
MSEAWIERAFGWLPVAMVLAFLGFALFVVSESRDWPEGARLFPYWIAIGTVLLAVAELADRLRRRLAPGPVVEEGLNLADLGGDAVERTAPFLRASIVLFCWVLGLYALTALIGLTLAVPVWVAALLRLRHRASWPATAALAAGLVGLVLLLEWALMMRIPPGVLIP